MAPPAADTKVNVSVRVRPLIQREIDSAESINWHNNDTFIQQCIPGTDTWIHTQAGYAFDFIFGQATNTAKVYEKVVAPIVQNSFQGFNGTVLCYGQTSSGKTHTLYGCEQDEGIISLTAQDLFNRINDDKTRTYYIRIGLLEVYNEKVTDLLNKGSNIEIKEINGVVVPKDLKEIEIVSADDMLRAAKRVQTQRKIGETRMNKESSRSHTILRIIIDSVPNESDEGEVQVTTALLNFVDLAGSEKASQTGAVGERFKESTFINKSLSTLSQVMLQLSGTMNVGNSSISVPNSSLGPNSSLSNTGSQSSKQPSKYVNFRDSKLTRILQSSLNGNAFISLICNVTPVAIDETHSTLRFARTAKKIKIEPTKNHGPANATQFRNKIVELEGLLNGKNSEVERLRKQLSAMQKFHPQSHQLSTGGIHHDRRKTMCPSMLVGLRNYEASGGERPMTAEDVDFDFKIPLTATFRRTSVASTFASSSMSASESLLFEKGSHDESGVSFPKFPRIEENQVFRPVMIDAQAQTDQARGGSLSPSQHQPKQQETCDSSNTSRISKRKIEVHKFLITDEFQQKTKEWQEQKSFLEHETEFEMEEAEILRAQVNQLKESLEESRAKLVEFSTDFEKLEEHNRELLKENLGLKEETKATQDKLTLSANQELALETSLSEVNSQSRELQQKYDSLLSKFEYLKSISKTQEEDNTILKLKVTASQEITSKYDCLLSEHETMVQRLGDLETENSLQKQELQETQSLRLQIDTLNQSGEELQSRLDRTLAELAEMKELNTQLQDNNDLAAQNVFQEKMETIDSEKKACEEMLEKARSDFKIQESDLENMTKENKLKTEECDRLQFQLSSLQTQIDALTEESSRAEDKLSDFDKLCEERESLKSQLERAIQENVVILKKNTDFEERESYFVKIEDKLQVLQSAMNSVTEENRTLKEEGKSAQDQLGLATTQKASLETSLNDVTAQLVELQERFDSLVLKIGDMESVAKIRDEENIALKEKIGTSEENTSRYHKLVSECDVLNARILALENESATQKQELQETQSLHLQIDALKHSSEELQSTLGKMSTELVEVKELNTQLQDKNHSSDLAALGDLQEKLEKIEAEKKTCLDILEKVRSDFKIQEIDLENMTKQNELKTEECDRLQFQLSSLQSQIDALTEESSRAEDKLSDFDKLCEERESLKSQLEQAIQENVGVLQKVREMEEREGSYAKLEDEFQILQSAMNFVAEENRTLKEETKTAEYLLTSATTQRASLETSLNDVTVQLRDLQERYDDLLINTGTSNFQDDENGAPKEKVDANEKPSSKNYSTVSECDVFNAPTPASENQSVPQKQEQEELLSLLLQIDTLKKSREELQTNLDVLSTKLADMTELNKKLHDKIHSGDEAALSAVQEQLEIICAGKKACEEKLEKARSEIKIQVSDLEILTTEKELKTDECESLKLQLERAVQENVVILKKISDFEEREIYFVKMEDELQVLQSAMNSFTEENQTLKEEAKTAQDQLGLATTQKASLETSLNDVTAQLGELQERYNCVLLKFDEMESTSKILGEENTSLKEKVGASEELASKYYSVISECEVLNTRIAALEIESSLQNQEQEETQCLRLQMDTLRQSCEELQSNVDVLSTKLAEMTELNKQLQDKNYSSDLAAQNVFQEKMETIDSEKKACEEMLEKARSDFKIQESDLENMTKENKLKTEECDRLQFQLSSLQTQIDALTEESSRAEDKLSDFDKLCEERESLKSQLERAIQENVGVLQKIRNMEEREGSHAKLENEFQVLQSAMKLVTDENNSLKDEAKTAEDQLRLITNERLTFESSHNDIIVQLGGLQERHDALLLKIGDMESTSKIQGDENLVLKQKVDINEELVTKYYSLVSECEVLHARIADLESESSTRKQEQEETQSLRLQIDSLKQSIAEYCAKLEKSSADIEDAKERNKKLQDENHSRNSAALNELQQQLEKANSENKTYKGILEKARSLCKIQEKDLETLTKEKEVKAEECLQLSYQLTSLQHRIDALTEESNRTEDVLSNFERLSEERERFKSQLEQVTEENLAVLKKLRDFEEMGNNYNKLELELKDLQLTLNTITEDNRRLQKEVIASEDQLKLVSAKGEASLGDLIVQSRMMQENYDCLLLKLEDLKSVSKVQEDENLILKEKAGSTEELVKKYHCIVSECETLNNRLGELENKNAAQYQEIQSLTQKLLNAEGNFTVKLGITQELQESYEILLGKFKLLETKLAETQAENTRIKSILSGRETEVIQLQERSQNFENVKQLLKATEIEKKGLEDTILSIQKQAVQTEETMNMLKEELKKLQVEIEREKLSYKNSVQDLLEQKKITEQQDTQLKSLKKDLQRKVQQLEEINKEYIKAQAVCQLHSSCGSVIDGLNKQLMNAEAEKENIRGNLNKQQLMQPPAPVKPSLRSAAVQTCPKIDIQEHLRQYKILAHKNDKLLSNEKISREREVSVLKYAVDELEKKLENANSENENLKSSLTFFAEEQENYKSMIKKPVPTSNGETQCDIIMDLLERAKRGEKGLKFPKGFPNYEEEMREKRSLKERVAVLEGWESRCKCKDTMSGNSSWGSAGMVAKARQKPLIATPTSAIAGAASGPTNGKPIEIKNGMPAPSAGMTAGVSKLQAHASQAPFPAQQNEQHLQKQQLVNRVQPHQQLSSASEGQPNLQLQESTRRQQLFSTLQSTLSSGAQHQQPVSVVTEREQQQLPMSLRSQSSGANSQCQQPPSLGTQREQPPPPTAQLQSRPSLAHLQQLRVPPTDRFQPRYVPQLVAQFQQASSPQRQQERPLQLQQVRAPQIQQVRPPVFQQVPLSRSIFDAVPELSEEERANEFMRLIDQMPESPGK